MIIRLGETSYEVERMKVRMAQLEELKSRVMSVEEQTRMINAKETDLRASCDLNFGIFTKGIHDNHHTSTQSKYYKFLNSSL
jgi:hypothetical protein